MERKEIPVQTLGEMAAETMRMEAASQRGIACPNCGCRDLRVCKTKPHDGDIGRRRECRYCGQRITTMEVAVS